MDEYISSIPIMVNNDSPFPFQAYASSSWSFYQPYQVFLDNDIEWNSGSSSPGYIGIRNLNKSSIYVDCIYIKTAIPKQYSIEVYGITSSGESHYIVNATPLINSNPLDECYYYPDKTLTFCEYRICISSVFHWQSIKLISFYKKKQSLYLYEQVKNTIESNRLFQELPILIEEV